MKNKGLIIFVIVLLVICVLLLSGILYLSLSKNNKLFKGVFKSYNVSNTKILEKEYDEELDYIDINTAAANIEIKRGDRTKLVVYGEKELLTLNEDAGLAISYDSKPCYFFCLGIDSARIVLYLQEDFAGNIKIDNDFGDIEIDEFKNATMKIESDYGDSSIDGGKNIDISSSCGEIKIGEVENATINNNFGDIKVSKITNKADIKADCGEIEIKEIDIKENSTIENNLGDIKIDRTNDILIESKVSLGDNKVNNNNYKSDIILKITNDCGDIRVN